MTEALDPELRDAYLKRLGLDAEPPSVEAMQRLHRRQVERVPYETLWIHGGEAWDIDPMASVRRIALDGRGGYCYQLNGAMAELLTSLGYDVRRHVGGVHGPDGPTDDEAGNHLVLTVRQLPTDANPAGVWYFDTGLGDALHEAMPLVPGDHRQGPFALKLTAAGGDANSGAAVNGGGTADRTGTWHLGHDPKGGFTGMRWTMADASWSDFAERHTWLSTSPESGFVRVGMAQCRDSEGVNCVRGLTVIRIGQNAGTGAPLTRRADWFGALRDLCGLHFGSTRPDVLDRLWNQTLRKHREWEASRT